MRIPRLNSPASLIALMTLVLSSCGGGGGGGENNTAPQSIEEGLSEEVLSELELADPASFTPQDVVFSDGTTLQDYRSDPNYVQPNLTAEALQTKNLQHRLETENPPSSQARINEIVKKVVDAEYLYSCRRNKYARACPDEKTWKYEEEKNDTDKIPRPKQIGLYYVWGSRTVITRQNPTAGCKDKYMAYGVDCSGLIYLSFNAAGINTNGAASASLALPETWNAFFPPEWNIKIESVNDSYKVGDVVVWSSGKNQHSAVAGTAGSDPIIISSTGGFDSCAVNIDGKHGPVPYPLSTLANTKLGKPTAHLRLKPKDDLKINPNIQPVTTDGVPVVLTASVNENEIKSEKYKVLWKFHDDSTGDTIPFTKKYATPGTYKITLTATLKDENGNPTGDPLTAETVINISAAGRYRGNFSGTDSGTFDVVFAENGGISGAANSVGVGPFTVSGKLNTGGSFTLSGGASTGAGFSGTLAAGNGMWLVAGTWANSITGDTGSFSGAQVLP